MFYTKKNNVYRIVRITGSQDNILGVTFGDKKTKVLEWSTKKNDKVRSSKQEILKQVMSGLESSNQSFETNYQLSEIYFLPSDSVRNSVYHLLIFELMKHYHYKKEFKQI